MRKLVFKRIWAALTRLSLRRFPEISVVLSTREKVKFARHTQGCFGGRFLHGFLLGELNSIASAFEDFLLLGFSATSGTWTL